MAADPAELWIRRPDVWAGAALAGASIVRSFRPSLMPRATPHQAMWVGTPYYSKFRDESLSNGELTDGLVEEANSVDDLRASPSHRRVTFLTHDNDPINLINATLFLREPSWLTEIPRKDGIPEDQAWMPMLTAFQTMVDAVNATNPIPGIFRATGHDYRLDLPRVTVAAYDLPKPTDEQWDALMDRFQTDEADRAAAMKLGEAEPISLDETPQGAPMDDETAR